MCPRGVRALGEAMQIHLDRGGRRADRCYPSRGDWRRQNVLSPGASRSTCRLSRGEPLARVVSSRVARRRHADAAVSAAGRLRYRPGFNPRRQRSPTPKPDYVLFRHGHVVAIADAKYRDLWEQSLPPSMLYQLSVYGIVKLRPTAVLDAQHGGFTAGSSPVSWGSIDELFVNLTIPRRPLTVDRCRPRACLVPSRPGHRRTSVGRGVRRPVR